MPALAGRNQATLFDLDGPQKPGVHPYCQIPFDMPGGPFSSPASTSPSLTKLGLAMSSLMPCHTSFWRRRILPQGPNPFSQLCVVLQPSPGRARRDSDPPSRILWIPRQRTEMKHFRTCSFISIHAGKDICMHACTHRHAHTHTHARTHTHTHTCNRLIIAAMNKVTIAYIIEMIVFYCGS